MTNPTATTPTRASQTDTDRPPIGPEPGLYLLGELDSTSTCRTAVAVIVVAGPLVDGHSRTIWIGENRADALANPAPVDNTGHPIGILQTDQTLLGLVHVPVQANRVTTEVVNALVTALRSARNPTQ